MKKAQFTPKSFIIGFIVFTLMMTGGIYMISQFALTNPKFTNSTDFIDFNKSFNKLEQVNASSSKLREDIENTKNDKFGLFGVLNGIIQAAWNTIQNIFISFSFIIDAIGGLSSVFGVPTWVVTLITSMIIVSFAFSIYQLIFRSNI